MANADAVDIVRTTSIVSRLCPQCGFNEAICEQTGGGSPARVTLCPKCGHCEESGAGGCSRRAGHGVFVLACDTGARLAGAFPRSIPDEQVASLRARFERMGAAVQFVSRWNEAESRLEVILEQ